MHFVRLQLECLLKCLARGIFLKSSEIFQSLEMTLTISSMAIPQTIYEDSSRKETQIYWELMAPTSVVEEI